MNLSDIAGMSFDYLEGLVAAKPSPLQRGQFYYATDENKLYYGSKDGTEKVISLAGGGGVGDMLKSVYDTDNDGRVDKAESLDNGTYTATAQDTADAVAKKHTRLHDLNSMSDHNPIVGSTVDNFLSLDDDGMPKDSGKNALSFAEAVHNHDASYYQKAQTYTQAQVDNLLTGKANTAHTQAANTITDFSDAVLQTMGTNMVDTATVDVNPFAPFSFGVKANSSVQKVEVAQNGTLVGTRKRVNLIPGSNVSIISADNAGQDRIDVTINSTGSGGGGTTSVYSLYVDQATPSPDKGGSTSANASFSNIIASVGSSERTLIITSGSYLLDTNITFPSTLRVAFEKGAKLTINGGVTVNFSGGIDAAPDEIFTGAGKALVTFAKGKMPYVYPQWWGAKADSDGQYSGTDNTAAFDAAGTAARAAQMNIKVISGKYRFASGFTYKAPIHGEGPERTQFYPNMNDGSFLILIDNEERWDLRDFSIHGQNILVGGVTASFTNGASSFTTNVNIDAVSLGDYCILAYEEPDSLKGYQKIVSKSGTTVTLEHEAYTKDDSNLAAGATIYKLLNSGGIKAQSSSNRYHMSNLYFTHLATGMEIYGFIGTFTNVWGWGCGKVLFGHLLNGVVLNINAENSYAGVYLSETSGVTIKGTIENCSVGVYLEQGKGALHPSEPMQGIVLDGMYMEGNAYHIKAGTVAGYDHAVQDITILGGRFIGAITTNGGGPREFALTQGLYFDNVRGISFAGNTYIQCPIRFTDNVHSVKKDGIGRSEHVEDKGYTQRIQMDSPNFFKPYENLIPDPCFRNALRGYQSVAFSNAKARVDTDGLRVTAINGTSSNCIELRLINDVIPHIIDKQLTVCGWVYIPNQAEFQGYPCLRPDITIVWKESTAAAAVESGPIKMNWKEGKWNPFIRELTIGSTYVDGEAYLRVKLYANNSATNSANDAYIIVNCLSLVPGKVSYQDMLGGNYTQHPLAPKGMGDKIITFGNTSTIAGIQTMLNGDRKFHLDPAAGGASEWVVTSEGTTGTLTAVTGDVTNGSPIITNVNDTTKLDHGMYITTVAGNITRAKILDISGSTVTVDQNANASQAGTAISYAAPVLKAVILEA